MRIVLLGDSHLARVRRDLPLLGADVCNAAEGGATALDLLAQAAGTAVDADDLVVVSVGTNDASPRSHVPVTAFARAVSGCLGSAPARRWVFAGDGLHLSGRAYRMVLPEIARAVRASA